MVDSVQRCSDCGHLSPADWQACHSCSGEFGDDADYSLDELNRYYRALEEGYGRYALLGYLLFFGVPIGSFFIVALLVAANLDSDALIGVVLLVTWFLLPVVGLSLLLGSFGHITGDSNVVGRGFAGTVLYGFLMAIVLGIVLAIASVIPLVNAIVALIGGILLLVSPYLAYRFYKRIQVDQATAVAALLAHAETLDDSLADALDTWAEEAEAPPARFEIGSVSGTVFENVTDKQCQEAVGTALAVLESAPPSRSPASYAELLPGRGERQGTSSKKRDAEPTPVATAPARDPETGAFTERGADSE